MKTNANDPAQPNEYGISYDLEGNICNQDYTGLTKFEHFAALAMQGLCNNEMLSDRDENNIAYMAVKQAKALIEAINEFNTGN